MSDNGPIQVNPEEARQGRTGVGMRYVLIGGIALALAAWGIVDLLVR